MTVGELPDFHFKCEKGIAILLNGRVHLLGKLRKLKDEIKAKDKELARLKDKYKQISGLYHPLLIDNLEVTRELKELKAKFSILF